MAARKNPAAAEPLPAAVALGKRRMELLTPEERQELAQKAGKGRLKTISPAKRKAIARKAAAARWEKKK